MTNLHILILLFMSSALFAQSDMIEYRDHTERTYTGFKQLINDGSEAIVGGLLDNDLVYDPSNNRLWSNNSGDTYLFRVNMRGRVNGQGRACRCEVYMFTGTGTDSVKVAQTDLAFKRRRFDVESDLTAFYTYPTFVANSAKVYCKFPGMTTIREVSYWFNRINRANAPVADSLAYAQVELAADAVPVLNSNLPLPIGLLGILPLERFTYNTGLFELTPDLTLVGRVVEFNVQATVRHTNRAELSLYLQRWDGTAWVELERASNYNTRDANQDVGTTTIAGYLYEVQAGDKYRVQYRLETDGGITVNTLIKAGGTRLSVRSL